MNQLVNKEAWISSVLDLFCVLQVMIQKHNQQMSFSLYISVLAVADTVALLIGNINNYILDMAYELLIRTSISSF